MDKGLIDPVSARMVDFPKNVLRLKTGNRRKGAGHEKSKYGMEQEGTA